MAVQHTQKTRKAAIYTRISRDAEGEKVGVQRQEKACRELAQQLNLDVTAVYSDNDVGASNRTGSKPREEYTAMLADIRSGLIQTVIAYSNSRLTRRPLEWIELIALAESGSLQIKTVVSGSHDLTTADGRAVALTVAAWDAAEADRISERQKAAFQDKAMQGKPKLQRQRPFGWKKDGVTIEPEEAKLIREAFQDILLGATTTSIARQWEEKGVLTAAGNAKWEQSVVHRIMTGWRTAGVRTYKREPLYDEHGKPIMGTWTPILTLEERSQALTALKAHSRTKKRQGKWLLSGLLRCGECAQALYGQMPSKYRTRAAYGCKNGHVAITAGILEEHVLAETMRELHRLDELQERGIEAAVATPPKPDPAIAERIEAISDKIPELMEAYRSGDLPAAIAFAEVDNLYAERTELQAKLDAAATLPPRPLPSLASKHTLEEDIALYQNTLRRHMPELPEGQKASTIEEQPPLVDQYTIDDTSKFLKLVIDSIVINKAENRSRKPEEIYKRVNILWGH